MQYIGGPIETPALDQLARTGLRFTQFHTAAICSPTRASLLTGRNPHNVAMGTVANYPTSFDGYTSVIPKSAGTVAAVLKDGGYNTAMFGKGHITPEWEASSSGPFDRWPTGLGFEYFYGFLGFDTDMWAPQLVENTSFIEPPHETPAKHFDAMMADRAIGWISQQKAVTPDKPFFIYYATGTAHAPHHAPKEWIERYRGKFDQGWDETRNRTFERQLEQGVIPPDTKLTPRSTTLPGWESLSADQKRLAARLMEVYAGSLAHADHQVGRVIDFLREIGEFDNTLVIFIQGDNGGSAEGGFNGLFFEQSYQNGFDEEFEYVLSRIDEIGGPAAYSNYPSSWGWAMNSPFQYYKQIASHFGGTRNGVVMSWPDRIKTGGEIRNQFHFVSDIMPTVLELAQIPVPAHLSGVKQDPLDGISMAYTFDNAQAPSARKTQVFECIDNFGIYHDGWFAGTKPVHEVWKNMWTRKSVDPKDRQWELYDVRTDYSQSVNLAETNSRKLEEMMEKFWSEASLNNILPIHPPTVGREGRPVINAGRDTFTYRNGITRVHVDAAPNTVGRSFTISASIVVGKNGNRGVLVSHGSTHSGYAFYIHDNRVFFHYNAVEPRTFTISTPDRLIPGRHELKAIFEIDQKKLTSGGTLKIEVDGKIEASGRIERTLRTFTNQEFNVGCDTLSSASPHYTIAGSVFDGELSKVVVDLR